MDRSSHCLILSHNFLDRLSEPLRTFARTNGFWPRFTRGISTIQVRYSVSHLLPNRSRFVV